MPEGCSEPHEARGNEHPCIGMRAAYQKVGEPKRGDRRGQDEASPLAVGVGEVARRERESGVGAEPGRGDHADLDVGEAEVGLDGGEHQRQEALIPVYD